MLVDKFSSKELDLRDYIDSFTRELERLIDAEANGKHIVAREKPEQNIKPNLLDAL